MVELSKQSMCVGEQSIAAFSQAYCETDIIVPDVKPDIVKILQADANINIGNKSCGSNRITVEGKADINVLYLGEDNCVYSINTTEQFSHLVDAKGVTDGMVPEIEVDVENIDCTVINSRKLSVKVLMGVDANAISQVEAELCTEIVDDAPFEILYDTVRPFVPVVRTADKFTIKEKIDIPSGKPSISNILHIGTKITDKECSVVANKVVIKGTLCVNTLYIGELSDNNIQYMEHEIPFVEVIEAEGAMEDMPVEVKLNIENTYYDILEDSDGDLRQMEIECVVLATIKINTEMQVDIIQDAYCIPCTYLAEKETTTVSRLVSDTKTTIGMRDVASMSPDFPEIMQVYNVVAKPNIATTEVQDGKVLLEGVIDAQILYLSNNPDSPVNCYKHQYKFSQTIDVDGAQADMICDIVVDIDHVSFNISMGREVELRFSMNVGIKIIASDAITYLCSLEKSEEEEEVKRGCCIRIYFVKDCDTLWDIAKRYKTTTGKIMEINEITGDSELFPGKQLLIG